MIWFGIACAATVHTVTGDIRRGAEPPLPMRASWPEGTGSLPVIVFSHGAGGSRDAYGPLVEAWAERGFLVLQPTHPDSLAMLTKAERAAAARNPTAFVTDPKTLEAWDERPREVSLALDHLDDLAPLGLDLSRIDREHVGIGGHSFGAHTAMLSGGLTFAGSTALAEPRADAILLLSPQGPGNGIEADSYRSMVLPTLVVTGSKDLSANGQGPEWRLEAWRGLGATDRWLLFLDGGTHGLGGISGRERADRKMLEAVIESTTAFWDATLRADPKARQTLDDGRTSDPRAHLSGPDR